tara:strand:- start:296 stop:613 length:318 start_codon:yes stop_codon:yes gene_type:complete
MSGAGIQLRLDKEEEIFGEMLEEASMETQKTSEGEQILKLFVKAWETEDIASYRIHRGHVKNHTAKQMVVSFIPVVPKNTYARIIKKAVRLLHKRHINNILYEEK